MSKKKCLNLRKLKVNLAISLILKMERYKSTSVVSSLYLSGVPLSGEGLESDPYKGVIRWSSSLTEADIGECERDEPRFL